MGHKDDTEKSANAEPALLVEFPLCSEQSRSLAP